MKLYQKSEWKEFRKEVLELDGNKCSKCNRDGNEITLQIHHKLYIDGRKPWEYGTKDCITLCKGCHAEEHGIIKPKAGWEYIGYEDLGDLNGSCENCGTSIRYRFLIYHKNWGTLEVGTLCCDNLTDSNMALNQLESLKKYESRKKRFINSKRWKEENSTYKINQNFFDIQITNNTSSFSINIHQMPSKKIYKSLMEAKSKAFDVIETGTLYKYLEKRNISFPKKKNNYPSASRSMNKK